MSSCGPSQSSLQGSSQGFENKRHVGPSSCTESEWVDGWAVVLVVLGGLAGGDGGGGWRCGSFEVCFVCCDFSCRCVYVFTFIGAPNP